MADFCPILTVAVPTYNMERYLSQNLQSLLAVKTDLIQVLILDNSSTDTSAQIADEFACAHPRRFTAIHKENHGYGSSVNWAVKHAHGRYLRIVDADDWVEPAELDALLQELETCVADLVLCDYTMVDDRTNVSTRVCTQPQGIAPGVPFRLRDIQGSFPKMHATVFRTDLLRENGIALLEDTFYVDEQLMLLACMHADTFVYYNHNIYCYRLGHASQSVNVQNMGKRYADRERELKSCLTSYKNWAAIHGPSEPCLQQLAQHVGNHFTTLLLYIVPPSRGRALADEWLAFLREQWPELAHATAGKRRILALMNRLHLGGQRYVTLKNICRK